MKIRQNIIIFLLMFSSQIAEAYVTNSPEWIVSGTYFHTNLVNTSGQENSPSGESWTSAFERAMQEWTDETNFNYYPLTESSQDPCPVDNINSVDFANDLCGTSFGSTTLAVALTLSSAGTPKFTEADIIFNDNYTWDIYIGNLLPGVVDFYRVALHELGHTLGLAHEDDGTPAIMKSVIGNLDSLQPDDIAGANSKSSTPSSSVTLNNTYVPLYLNSSWKYMVNSSSYYSATVLDRTNGPQKVVVDSNNIVEYYETTSSSVNLHRTFNGGDFLTFAPAVKIISNAPVVSEVLNESGTATFFFPSIGNFNLNYSSTAEVQAIEPLATALGTFDAVRVLVTINITGTILGTPYNDIDTTTFWFVEHLGVVRIVDANTREIISASVDGDNDQINDYQDNCPTIANNDQANNDGDSQGDVCDIDDDNDGTPDSSDAFPFDDTEDRDSDGDGIGDNSDSCPTDFDVTNVNTDGDALCNTNDTDDDNDGMSDVYETANGLNPLVDDAASDLDGDGFTNFEEFLAGTDPDDANDFPSIVKNDFNGDGNADVLLRHTNGQWYLYELDGNTLLGQGGVGMTTNMAWSVISTDDFNGDGNADVLLRHANGQWYLYELDGNTLLGQGGVGMTTNMAWSVISTDDFNGDGNADVLLRHASGQWYLYELDGNTLLGQGGVGMTTNTAWSVISTDDFNGDGNADVLLRHASGQWYLYELDGNTLLGQGGVGMTTNTAWSVISTDDFNGDGNADVLLRHASGQWYLYELDGNTLLGQGGVGMTTNMAWSVISTDDFNGDGNADVLLRHASGQWYLYELDGNTLLGQGGVGMTTNMAWSVISTDDFNGDGNADVLLRHTNGQWYLYELDGNTLLGQGGVGMTTNTVWAVENQ